ncbi:hypothetical protein SAMN02745116_00164 [Pilibacter termitis]|uniref:SpaA-like prealbumin fold domain-containing protein n=1 Tax=Pilibacter termitis TaxID=263852 RepID=A0A1T4KB77_9ENTE|nr:hypothetical protein [Pilibacter termitis]SJZ39627.1 hypothetical protein SAMN02745116_00164 [Pilibacter termitis]
MKKRKNRVGGVLGFVLLLACFLSPMASKANSLVPQDALLDNSTDRVITIARIKGGNGTLDSSSIVAAQGDASAMNGVLTGGWQVDNAGSAATYRISKLHVNAANTAPVDNPINYTVIGSVEITTSGGIAEINLGSPTHHASAIQDEGFYTKDPQGTPMDAGDEDKGSPDGYYLVEAADTAQGSLGYREFVTVPFVREVDDGGGHSKGEITYNIHLFPKVVKTINMEFQTAVNILQSDGKTPYQPRFADKSVWQHDTVANGSTNTWTLMANYSKSIIGLMQDPGTSDPANFLNLYHIGLGWDPRYQTAESTVNTNDYNALFTKSTDGNISNTFQPGAMSIGILITNLNDDTYEYFDCGKVTYTSSPPQQLSTSFKYGGVTFNYRSYSGTQTLSNGTATYGIAIPREWSDANHFGVNNPFGDKYKGIDLADAKQGYQIQVCLNIIAQVNGRDFAAQRLATGGTLDGKPARPYACGWYMSANTPNILAVTPWGGGKDAVGNGLPAGTVNGDDGAKSDTNPNGVFTKQAYITTGQINARKINSNGNDLTGAKFKLRVKDTHGENTAVEGQYVVRNGDAVLANGTGVLTYTATQASGTTFTSGDTTIAGVVASGFDPIGIDPDWDYELIETTAPDTYQLLSKPMLIPSTNVSQVLYETDLANDSLVKVVNIKKMILPVTGGIGIGVIVLIGIILTIVGFHGKRKLIQTERSELT